MNSGCIFCKIANKQTPSEILFEDEDLFVIKDLYPKAPVHLLVITKAHISSVNDLELVNAGLISKIVLTAKQQAVVFGIAEKGYKLVWNVGHDGGQVIPHLHLHLLGGKKLTE